MKKILIPFALLITLISQAQSVNQLVIGSADTIHSSILHEDRPIWVHMPDTTSPDGIFAKQHYPVVYLLDGDATNFSTMASLIQQAGAGGGNLSFPQMIVVGIPNTDRTRDLTPSHPDSAPMLDSVSLAHSGGGENFIAFMQKELIPHIDSAYPTAPYSLLIGHSFGGLMAVHILVNHPSLFNSYLAIDPSMFWDHQKLLKQAKTITGNQLAGHSLFLAMANTMPGKMDTSLVKSDRSDLTLHIRSIMDLGHSFSANHKNGLSFDWKYYPAYNHGSVPFIAVFDGIHSLFSFYPFDLNFREFFNPGYKSDAALSKHYDSLSIKMGYRLTPPEQLINGLGYQLMGSKQFERAEYFFGLNTRNYPQSFNAFDSMGDLYNNWGKKDKAIEYYSKALALREFPDTRAKLEKLQKNK